jgi:hypothetical protein
VQLPSSVILARSAGYLAVDATWYVRNGENRLAPCRVATNL